MQPKRPKLAVGPLPYGNRMLLIMILKPKKDYEKC